VSTDEYATVTVASLYGDRLATSGYVLVQVATRERPTGWVETPVALSGTDSSLEVTSFGAAPWLVRRSNVTVHLRNTVVSEAVVLDMNMKPVRTDPLTPAAGWVQYQVPGDRMYVLLRNPSVSVGRAGVQRVAAVGVTPVHGGIALASQEALGSVRVFDAAGRTVAAIDVSRLSSARVEGLAAGSYLVRVTRGASEIVRPVVVR
jgi:hypothetical protein